MSTKYNPTLHNVVEHFRQVAKREGLTTESLSDEQVWNIRCESLCDTCDEDTELVFIGKIRRLNNKS